MASSSVVNCSWWYLVVPWSMTSSPAAMDAAECTLAQSKQNFVPASPLEAHTCLWAAPSAKQIPQMKWRRMLGPYGLFKSRPPRGSAMGLHAKNGLQDLPKNLADSSGQLGHERGAFKADGKPDVLMGQGLLAQLAERAVNRPELALSTT